MTIDTELNSLLTNTKAFLESNALIIYGSNKGGSGIKNFVMQGTDETRWQSAAGGAAKTVPFYVIYDATGFNGKGAGPKSQAFSAHYISMREFNVGTGSWEDANVTHYNLPTNGATTMVTSKLNGCTFGIGSNAGGGRLVSHLRPPQEPGPAAGRLYLDKGTRAGFSGGKLDVSVMSSEEQNGTVIGILSRTGWTFFAQRFQMVSGAVGIISNVQVYT